MNNTVKFIEPCFFTDGLKYSDLIFLIKLLYNILCVSPSPFICMYLRSRLNGFSLRFNVRFVSFPYIDCLLIVDAPSSISVPLCPGLALEKACSIDCGLLNTELWKYDPIRDEADFYIFLFILPASPICF